MEGKFPEGETVVINDYAKIVLIDKEGQESEETIFLYTAKRIGNILNFEGRGEDGGMITFGFEQALLS